MYEFTQEDRRRGGVASGEARRNKRTLRETAEILLQTELPADVKAELSAKGFECETVMDAIVAGVIESAISGNSQAFANIMKLLGEDSQRIELSRFDESAARLDEWFKQAQEEYKNKREKVNNKPTI